MKKRFCHQGRMNSSLSHWQTLLTIGVVYAWQRTAWTPVGGREMCRVENVEADGKQYENDEYNEGNPETCTFPSDYVQVLEHRYSSEHTLTYRHIRTQPYTQALASCLIYAPKWASAVYV